MGNPLFQKVHFLKQVNRVENITSVTRKGKYGDCQK